MNILFLCEGSTVPASRFRVAQFLPHFEQAGIRATVRYGYGARFNQLSRTALSTPYRLATRLKRAASVLDAGKYDLVFCQRPALPQSSLPEAFLRKLNPRIVFDFDDAIWLGPNGVSAPRRRRAFDEITQLASHLIAGNNFLKNEANQPDKTSVIPTVIDADRYCPSAPDRKRLVLGWMGTSGNFPFLAKLVPSLKRVLQKHPEAIVRLVSNAPFPALADHPQVEQVAWTAESELEELRSFSIGLMPLVSSELTRGKCAFKMITYMAVGTPVLVSDVGANREVFGTGGAGYLLPSFDWDRELSELIENQATRDSMGEVGRAQVLEAYSVQSVLPRYLEIFENVRNA
tara:strand:+ start:55987 stop:57024 length:1038 start_codon:yes stop_codon:yes gene_type:complete